jgi:hypothetical protein
MSRQQAWRWGKLLIESGEFVRIPEQSKNDEKELSLLYIDCPRNHMKDKERETVRAAKSSQRCRTQVW